MVPIKHVSPEHIDRTQVYPAIDIWPSGHRLFSTSDGPGTVVCNYSESEPVSSSQDLGEATILVMDLVLVFSPSQRSSAPILSRAPIRGH